MGDERCGAGYPRTYLVSAETHEIGIVALLPTLEEVIVYTGELPGDLPCPHIMTIEKAADTRVFRGGKPITHEQR
jgi:hypothetical protein